MREEFVKKVYVSYYEFPTLIHHVTASQKGQRS